MLAGLFLEIIMMVMGIGGMQMFISEEALQANSMAIYLALRGEEYGIAKDALYEYDKRLDYNGKHALPIGGTLNGLLRDPFEQFDHASREARKVYSALIAAGLKPKPEELFWKIRIVSQPSDAKIYIYDWEKLKWVDTDKATPETFKGGMLTKQIYLISRYDARKKKYRQKVLEIKPALMRKVDAIVNLYIDPYMSDEEGPQMPFEEYAKIGAYQKISM